MQTDAHYYATMAFCRACGFDKESAHIVGYASQFVDDAKINLMLLDEADLSTRDLLIRDLSIEHDLIEGRTAFFNMATCHSYNRLKTYNYEAMVSNTCAFHFVPGCTGDSFTKKLRCKERSPVIIDIMKDALTEGDLAKLGIVLHVYVDTFSHQGFCGLLSKVNDIRNCWPRSKLYATAQDRLIIIAKSLINQWREESSDTVFDHVVPAYGHGQALDYPDFPYLNWSYEFDCSERFNGDYKAVQINNPQRFIRAFRGVMDYLQEFLAGHPQYLDESLEFKDFRLLFKTLISSGTLEQRESHWRKVMVKQKLYDKNDQAYLFYKDNQWLKDAFSNYDPIIFDDRIVVGVKLARAFVNSNWYKYYQAVKWYKFKFFEYCAKYGLDIAR